MRFAFHPLTSQRWADCEALFGAKGACAGCWCMYWRQRGKLFKERTNEGNKAQFRALVEQGPPPGLLAYAGDTAVGWCQVGPQASYARFVHSRTRQPLDARPTFVINCFYVARACRGQGLMPRLIEAAVAFARDHGAQRLEGFPANTAKGRLPPAFAYTGTPSAFRAAGFREHSVRLGEATHVRYVREL